MDYSLLESLRTRACANLANQPRSRVVKGMAAKWKAPQPDPLKCVGVEPSRIHWDFIGARKPSEGRVLQHPALAQALLLSKTSFTHTEWAELGVGDVRRGDVIKSGDYYFRAASAWEAEVEAAKALLSDFNLSGRGLGVDSIRNPQPKFRTLSCPTLTSLVVGLVWTLRLAELRNSTGERQCEAVTEATHRQRLMHVCLSG